MSELFLHSAPPVNRDDAAPGNQDDLRRAAAGDQSAFARIVVPLRPELFAHCYRMLGSTADADDALQEAMVRAWRGLAGFGGRGSLRSWLYTVVTRTCLDAVAGRARRALPVDLGPSSDHPVLGDAPAAGVDWLEPLPGTGPTQQSAAPAARYEQREAVELAFVAALTHLPGNQRAALLLFDVLGFSAAEIASMMDTSVAAVNSALQRARQIVADRVPPRSQQRTLARLGDARLRTVVASFADALERGDADALIALLTEDVTWSMPPLPGWYQGLAAVTEFAVAVPLGSCGAWRHLPTTANAQPAVAGYLWNATSRSFAAWSINVLTMRGDRIAEITSFLGARHHAQFGLPAELPA